MADNKRDLALFNMAVDSKLRGCDLVCLKVRDVFAAGRVKERAFVTQNKTGKLRAVELLLGHTKMDRAVRCVGVDLDDALTLSGCIDL